MQKTVKPYGLWPSPISPGLLSTQLRFSSVLWDSDGETLVWLEGRSDRGVLVAQTGNEAPRDLTYEGSVRAGIGYGGGDFTVRNGVVVFSEKNGRLYRLSLGYGQPQPITTQFGNAASPAISPDGKWVLYVHSSEKKDSLGLVDAHGETWPIRLVSGSDFYMQPTWHPSGKQIAWVEWDHPQMPWDGTRLKLASFENGSLQIAQGELIAGSSDIPVFQPEFSPDGQWLAFIAQDGEWDQLVLLDLKTGQKKTLVDGCSMMLPAWVQGMRVYGWSPSSQALYYQRNDAGFASLWRVDIQGGPPERIDLDGYTWFEQVAVSPTGEKIAVVAESASIPNRIITVEKNDIHIVRRSLPEVVSPEDLPELRLISWQAPDETKVYGLYAPPANARFAGEGLPPAVIYVHGGPTSQTTAGYSGDRAFFTSRGYAWLDVNYRGSTGFGRSYMLALRENWGLLDTEDTAGGADALVAQGLADPHRLVVKGGSAGGYAVLNVLIKYPGKFKAGICMYGISNLYTFASDTHKFEEFYNDSMVGPLPEAAERYQAWSAIFHADQIRDPLAVFQGSADVVVPPDQSDTIVELLKANHVPYLYRLYEGEGHGFRRSETITSLYEDIDRFLKQYVILAP